MADTAHKRLALAIIDFLSTSLKDGTLTSEDTDSIEIAQNCIAEAFRVNAAKKSATAQAPGDQNLLSIYGVYEKLKGKNTTSPQGSNTASEARSTSSAVPPKAGSPSEESEKLKGQGNAAMQKKDYPSAIDCYTQALEISPLNPIYLSNRAAAYSAANQHDFAKNDAELATAADPKYTKAWSRLGLARFALGDAKGSMEAYQKGIEAEGSGGSDAMKKGFETAKRRVEEESGTDEAMEVEEETARGGNGSGMPDLSSLAGMLGGGGGGGGGGGMPDLGSLMQNPMMRQMAQNLMSNPDMMSNLMNNPQLRDMAGRFGGGGGGGAAGGSGGGGGPDLSALMNDPNIANLARNFMGGMGGAGAGRGAGGNQ